jgi:hypothetical protein
MAHLFTGDLAPDSFLSFCEGLVWPDGAILAAFTPAEFKFEAYFFDAGIIRQAEQGRIFHPEGELCWRKLGSKIRAVYLGARNNLQELSDCSDQLEGLLRAERQFVLWGERTNRQNEWLEQQVPHRFVYPIDSNIFSRGRVSLVVEDWTDKYSEMPQFSRYHSLAEMKGTE